jgi:serine phosphatase RsbU (regulator of sigma subunit)
VKTVRCSAKRLKAKIREYRDATARELIAAITCALNDFRGQTPPDDDVTMVVIKATG